MKVMGIRMGEDKGRAKGKERKQGPKGRLIGHDIREDLLEDGVADAFENKLNVLGRNGDCEMCIYRMFLFVPFHELLFNKLPGSVEGLLAFEIRETGLQVHPLYFFFE